MPTYLSICIHSHKEALIPSDSEHQQDFEKKGMGDLESFPTTVPLLMFFLWQIDTKHVPANTCSLFLTEYPLMLLSFICILYFQQNFFFFIFHKFFYITYMKIYLLYHYFVAYFADVQLVYNIVSQDCIHYTYHIELGLWKGTGALIQTGSLFMLHSPCWQHSMKAENQSKYRPRFF